MLQIKHLNKYFGENHVLKDISLEIESHKTMAIIGSSGSGKSTLLRCINLLETPDSGTISLDGKALDFSKNFPNIKSCLYQENRHGFRASISFRTKPPLKTSWKDQ